MSHIAVERNRRRQMNEHLKVLRSLTPCFYIKRGDQASIIGGVIEFIKELHQVLQSLESKKRRKSLSPSPSPSPRRVLLLQPIPQLDSTFGLENVKELGACCNSPVADIEAKISGSNVLLKVISRPIPGQIMRIISVLERLSFEVLHLNISSMEDTVLYSFVIKNAEFTGEYLRVSILHVADIHGALNDYRIHYLPDPKLDGMRHIYLEWHRKQTFMHI